MTEKTKEQIAAEAAAQKEAEKKAAAEQKKAQAEVAKAEKAAAAAKAKQEREDKAAAEKAAKAEKQAAAAKAKEDAKAAKEAEKKAAADAKAAKQAEKDAAKMPEQNGIRRPRPDGDCGKVWALADSLTSEQGSPVAIATLMKATTAQGINDSTTRTQYARWRTYNGVTGRVVAPQPSPASTAPQTPAA